MTLTGSESSSKTPLLNRFSHQAKGVQDESQAIIGAVGISGDTSDIDEECAVAGIEAAGLTADTGVPS